MIPELGIVNMNGRLYDPVLGRFFSPDNYVQMPDNSQSFNRYSYCLNNPLKYTDPSGEYILIDDIFAAIIGGTLNVVANAIFGNIHSWKQGLAQFGIGALAGLATEYGGPMVSAMVVGCGNSIVNQGFENGFNHISWDNVFGATIMSMVTAGLGAELTGSLSPLLNRIPSLGSTAFDNMLRQACGAAFSGFTLETIFALGSGKSIGESFKSGFDGLVDGAVLGAVSGLGTGIREAHAEKANPWTGEKRHGHHSYPKFLGGDTDQPLTEMSKSRHLELHKEMNEYLKDITNENGQNMRPTRGNSGRDIKANFSPEMRFNTAKDFYDQHPIKYWDARWDFYRNNHILYRWKPW